jgi:hypothetical protein
MTDIVERLRSAHLSSGVGALMHEAAAEIERLTGLLANSEMTVAELLANDGRLRAESDISDGLLADAKADNARLRAALQSLTHDPPATLDEPDTDAEVVIKMREIARRALENKP